MEKRIVNTLLRIFHSTETRFSAGKGISAFCTEYNLGMRQGSSFVFTDAHKVEIGRILQGEFGINPITTNIESWKELGRAESLSLGRNEKFATRAVGEGRLRVKTLPGRILQVAGGIWSLPERADLGMDLGTILDKEIRHDALLIIENLQTFHDIHQVNLDVMVNLPAHDPLVVFRGDAQGGAQVDAVHALVRYTKFPVFAFVDFDPAGLLIALNLPRLNEVLAPSLQDLAEIIQSQGIASRYLEQVAAAPHVQKQIQADARLASLWKVIHGTGKALPQEYFHSQQVK